MKNIKQKNNHRESLHRGFSLIEIIIYISLLSILIVGVFSFTLSSFYIGMKKPAINNEDYQSLIKNYHVKE